MSGAHNSLSTGWPLRRRLLLLYVALIALVLLGAAGSLVALQVSGRATNVVEKQLGPAQVSTAELSEAYRNIEADLRAYLGSTDGAALRPITTNRRQVADLLTSLQTQLRNEPQALTALAAVNTAADDWLTHTVDPTIAARQAAGTAASTSSTTDDRTRFQTLRTALDTLSTRVTGRVTAEEQQAHRSTTLVAALAVASTAFGLFVGVGAYFMLRVSLTRPLDRLVERIGLVAGGDLESPVPASGPTELATLGAAAERMRQHLLDDALGRVNSALIDGQESERRRIAGQIHDDQVQAMTAASLRLQQLRRRLTDPDLVRLASAAEESTNHATSRLRRMIFELYSPVLESEGLVPALEMYLEETFTGDTDAQVTGTTGHLPEPVAALAYRIARESLWNVYKHADARHVTVTVERDATGVEVSITDDGRGFDPNQVDATAGHLGIDHSRQLATAGGGWWHITSATNRGTTVRFRLPVAVT